MSFVSSTSSVLFTPLVRSRVPRPFRAVPAAVSPGDALAFHERKFVA